MQSNMAPRVGITMIVSKLMSASLLAAGALAVPTTAGEIHELLGPGSTRDIPRAQELLRSDPKLVSARDAHLQETPLHIVARFGPLEGRAADQDEGGCERDGLHPREKSAIHPANAASCRGGKGGGGVFN